MKDQVGAHVENDRGVVLGRIVALPARASPEALADRIIIVRDVGFDGLIGPTCKGLGNWRRIN